MFTSAEQAVSWFHSLERFGIKPGLERISALCEAIGHPERKTRFIHVAGTNGKGTVCTEIACVLRAAGFRTGLYVSPYVIDFRERIQIDGQMIAPEALTAAAGLVYDAAQKLAARGMQPTEFEAVTAAAFQCFAAAGCDVVVLETGLGGRFDATNIITEPIVSVITSVSLDHVNVLGHTVAEIAFEKAGIIKDTCYAVTSASQPESVLTVLKTVAEQKRSHMFTVAPASLFETGAADITGTDITYRGLTIHVPFPGEHQLENAALAIKACEVIGVNGLDLTPAHIKAGIEAAVNPARTEVLSNAPFILLDGSHNDASTKALAGVLRTHCAGKRLLAVMGMMQDKDCAAAVQNLRPCFAHVLAVTPTNPRAMQSEAFCALLRQNGLSAEAAGEPARGVERAFQLLPGYDGLVVCGSLYLASDVRDIIKRKLNEFT